MINVRQAPELIVEEAKRLVNIRYADEKYNLITLCKESLKDLTITLLENMRNVCPEYYEAEGRNWDVPEYSSLTKALEIIKNE